MAEGDKGKNIVVGEGEETNRSPFPPGFRFTPTDDELVEYYLLPRLQGRPHVPNAAIIDDYVYQCHPDDLTTNGKYKDRGQDDTWYFLSSRERKYVNGDRPSRSTEDGCGRWKASTGSKSAVTGSGVEYTFSNLGYYDGPIKEEDKGKWLMHELTVPEYENKIDRNGHRSARDTLDEYVMCKIYQTVREPKNKNKSDGAGPSGTCEDTCPVPSPPGPAESGQDQETVKPKLPERRKRKRPVEAATPKQEPPAPAPAHRCLGLQPQAGPSPTQFYGGATQMRFGATGYHHYGGTGRPMAFNPRTAMPPPTMAFNPHAAMPRPPMAFTGQVAPYQAALAAAPGAFGQATMMRRLGRPPRPPTVPRYPAMQRPPETEEMRRSRVYQQHLNELTMMRGNGMMQQQQAGNAAYPAQQPQPMAFMLQQQQKQQPYFGAGFNHQYVRPMAPQYLPCNYHQPVEEVGQQVQYSYAVPDYGAAATTTLAETEAGIVGATNEGIDIRGDCNNDEMDGSVEVATKKVLPDGRTSADGGDTRQDPPH